MNPTTDLEVFVAVVEAGSLSAAAERLALSVAVASKRLARLEARLGVRLLARTTRRQSLTEAGETYLVHARRILEDIAAADASVADLGSVPRGRLRVSAPATFGRQQLSPAVPGFLARYPEIALQLELDDAVVDLHERRIDVAIRVGPLRDSSLIATRLAAAHRVVCAAPAYLERHGVPRVPEDLVDHRCLLLSEDTADGAVWSFGRGDGTRRVRVGGPLSTNNGEVVRDAVVGGAGIAIKSTWDIARELASGELVEVLADWPTEPIEIHALHHDRAASLAKVRVWIEFFRERFSPVPPWERATDRANGLGDPIVVDEA